MFENITQMRIRNENFHSWSQTYNWECTESVLIFNLRVPVNIIYFEDLEYF